MDTRPPIRAVLMPGLDGTGDLFAPAVAACPSTIDPLVMRYSADTPTAFDAIAAEVIDQLDDDGRPLVLIGESFSGPVALHVANARPAGLAAVVLVASFVEAPGPTWTRLLPWATIMSATMPAAVARMFLLGESASDDDVQAFRRAVTSVPSTVLAARLRAVLTVDARSELTKCPAPVLYLQAADDRLVSRQSAKAVTACRPDAAIFPIEGPHLLMQTSPTACWQAIEQFVEQTRTPADP